LRQECEYHRPGSLDEACSLLQELGANGTPLAGGTDIVVDLRRGAVQAGHLVSLGALEEMRGIRVSEGELKIGALTTPARIETSEAVRDHRPELLDSVGAFGTPQVRHRATVGGSLCTAASCGDLAPLLMALDARVVIAGPGERRELPLREFFTEHRRTVLEPGTLVVEVVVPVRRPNEGAAYQTFGLRAANFITVAAVAAAIQLEDGTCREARLVLGAVAPTPLLVQAAGERLVGGRLDDAALRDAARAAGAAALPITDVRGSAEHRRELVEVLATRTLSLARERAR